MEVLLLVASTPVRLILSILILVCMLRNFLVHYTLFPFLACFYRQAIALYSSVWLQNLRSHELVGIKRQTCCNTCGLLGHCLQGCPHNPVHPYPSNLHSGSSTHLCCMHWLYFILSTNRNSIFMIGHMNQGYFFISFSHYFLHNLIWKYFLIKRITRFTCMTSTSWTFTLWHDEIHGYK